MSARCRTRRRLRAHACRRMESLEKASTCSVKGHIHRVLLQILAAARRRLGPRGVIDSPRALVSFELIFLPQRGRVRAAQSANGQSGQRG
ncbi:hypothetical protein FKM82_030070 [Ascaphus truei]